MHYLRIYSLLFLIGLSFFSCSKKDYEAQIPTYISIDNITMVTDYTTQGSASANITDAWVYINDDLVGTYELPAKFPVLKEGNVEIKIFGGIKDNGIASNRKRYLLYDPHVEQVNLVKGETLNFNPTISYSSSATFAWLEDFENASLSFLYTLDSDTIINKQSYDVKEGSFAGQVYLDTGMDFFEATSSAYTTIPRNGSPVYFEMDFKTNEQFLVGIYLDSGQYAFLTLNTTTTWKKVYINLTDLINSNPASSQMKVFFGLKTAVGAPFVSANPEFFIDNLKLVHL